MLFKLKTWLMKKESLKNLSSNRTKKKYLYVNVISSDPAGKDGIPRFKTVSSKP